MDRFHFLPFGKTYHIFFFNEWFQHDKDWTHNVIERLEYCGYVSGCITDDFEPALSVFENVKQKVIQSISVAFVISEKSVKSKAFIHHLENAVLFTIDSEDSKPMLPILLDENISIPNCLRNYQPLYITDDNKKWWKSLLKVLESYSYSSSSGESDEELNNMFEQLETMLAQKSIRQQKKFRQKCRQSGISQLTSQMGTRCLHVGLLKGCGVEIVEQNMILKWDRFENVMLENRDTLVKIVNFNQECRIREVTINLTKDGQEKIIDGLSEWNDKFVKFIEHSLNYEFSRGNFDRMTYNVRFEGHTSYALLHSMINIARNIYLNTYKSHCSKFDTIEKRIETFHNWPYDRNVVQALVEAGYVYTGELDTVVCFSCNQSLFGINATQTREHLLWDHILWSEDCTFLNNSNDNIIQSLIMEVKSSYGKDSVNPYIPKDTYTLYEKTIINHRILRTFDTPFNAFMLAKIGFVIAASNKMDFGVLCEDCNYMRYGVKSIPDLEYHHMLWSGEECPFLVRRKGIKAIQQFKRDNELRVQYKSSISFKSILIKRNP